MGEASERKWTREQLSAINTRDKTLLVSAAAGSGKTATLTERIIRSLTDTESPVEISSLLIVTFTRAAASELRVKITKALENACKADPENKELERQLYLLPTAKIRTIDAFCNDILKNNTDTVGISPSYRLSDRAEEELLSQKILEGMIDALYADELCEVASSADFDKLTDCLTESKRRDDISDTFKLIYSKLETEVLGVKALLPLIEKLNPDNFTSVGESEYGSLMLGKLRGAAGHYLKIYESYEKEFSSGSEAESKYHPTLLDDMSLFNTLLEGDYSKIRELFKSEKLFTSLSSVRKNRSASMDEFKAYRDQAKTEISLFSKYFHYSEEDWKKLYSEMYPLLIVFYRCLEYFDKLFFEEKRRRNCFSYSDIARLAYNCLVKDGKPTDVALSMKKSFSAIYIDEYQDVNPLQNSIFEAISRENNRFMVGDIKQSIYVFRKAKPEIFANMKTSFPKLGEAEGDEAGIFMSENFRSDEAIIDFVNGIFDKIFSLTGESIGYEPEDRLIRGKNCVGVEYKKPQIVLIEKGDGVLDSEENVTALKIKELLEKGRKNDGTPILPSDIAILLRSAKEKDTKFASALEKLGIPSSTAAKDDFFLTSEVLLALSVLNSIDNPRRDVYLAGYMCSPLAGFTGGDIYRIRKEGSGGCLFEALVSYCEKHKDFEKGKSFLQQLSYYRTIAEGIGIEELIYKIYHETGLMALAVKNGGKDNLTLLYDYARGYESGSFKGLYSFINFINNIINKRDTEFDDKREGTEADAVKIMTCHASKGLEYPVVFLVDSGNRISNKDASARVAYSDELGLAFRLRTPSGLLPVDNPVRDIINLYNSSKNYEEELRILYVALTRARERLFVVGTSPLDDSAEYLERCAMERAWLDSYSAGSLSSFLEIAIAASDTQPVGVFGFLDGEVLKYKECFETEEESAVDISSEDFGSDVIDIPDNGLAASKSIDVFEDLEEQTIDLKLYEEMKRRFDYRYPAELLTKLPEKLSVSKSSPTVLDGSEDLSLSVFENAEEKKILPSFAAKNPAEESAKRGIATHYFLQFCDLENLRNSGGEPELLRLVSGGFISKKDAERVRIDEIELFRGSKLFEKMLNAKKLYREFRFTVTIPASSLTSEEEKIAAYEGKNVLVQGVIDCISENPDGTLSLYDYKTDRLTKEELADKALAKETLRKKHATQLSYYAMAVERIFGRAPCEVEVYSLHLGDTVDVSL